MKLLEIGFRYLKDIKVNIAERAQEEGKLSDS